jgi:hypothetical protein
LSRAKGSVVVGAVRALRKRKDEARAVLPEPLHGYLAERIVTSRWYPEEDLLALIRALLEITPGDRGAALREMGAATATALGEGVYSHLIGERSSTSTTFALWSTMHDTGTLKSHFDRENAEVVFELRDFGLPSRELCAITTGFIEQSIRMGGRSHEVSKDACVLDGGDCCRWKTR